MSPVVRAGYKVLLSSLYLTMGGWLNREDNKPAHVRIPSMGFVETSPS